jgi:hypothetical protein
VGAPAAGAVIGPLLGQVQLPADQRAAPRPSSPRSGRARPCRGPAFQRCKSCAGSGPDAPVGWSVNRSDTPERRETPGRRRPGSRTVPPHGRGQLSRDMHPSPHCASRRGYPGVGTAGQDRRIPPPPRTPPPVDPLHQDGEHHWGRIC